MLDAVERAVDRPAGSDASSSSAATAASVQNRVISVAMSGSIIPTPLAMPTTAPPRRRRSCARRTLATVSVVMIAAAAGVGVGRRRAAAGERGEAGADAVHRVAAGRSRRSRRRARRSARSRGAAATPAASSSASAQALRRRWRRWRSWRRRRRPARRPSATLRAADRHARPGEAAAGEHAGGGARAGRRRDDEVVGVVLDADVGDVGAEALGEGGAHVVHDCQRASGAPLADRREDRSAQHCVDLRGTTSRIEQVTAHAGDVVRAAADHPLEAGLGEVGVHHPHDPWARRWRSTRPWRTIARRDRRSHREARVGLAQATGAEQRERQLSTPHPSLGRLGQVDEHLEVAREGRGLPARRRGRSRTSSTAERSTKLRHAADSRVVSQVPAMPPS